MELDVDVVLDALGIDSVKVSFRVRDPPHPQLGRQCRLADLGEGDMPFEGTTASIRILTVEKYGTVSIRLTNARSSRTRPTGEWRHWIGLLRFK